jgi:uncharacterized iron-regulated protein
MRRGALILLGASIGCAHGASAPPPHSSGTETSTHAEMPAGHGHKHGDMAMHWSLPHRLIDGKNASVLDSGSVFDELLSSRVIYVSEQHNNPHHHAAQLSVIAGIYARDPSVAIGMEMFKVPFQHVLDDYLAEKIDAEQLVEQSEWEDRWGYDFDLYRPILEFARAHHLKVYALNAPDEITRKVADEGVKGLSEAEKKSLPDLDLSNKEHREMLREIYDAHHAHASGSFEDFYTAQVIWDETMAYEVARVMKEPSGPKHMVVLAGDGHIRYGLGIPSRAARRGATPFKTVLPVMIRELDDAVEEGSSDYLWVMAMKDSDLPRGHAGE